MKVGIHPERYRNISSFIRKYEIILKHNGIDCEYIHISDPDFFNRIKECDAFIYRWYHYDYDRQLATTILPLIRNHLRIKCFPDEATDWHFDDKIKQYYLMNHYGFPMCRTWIFWEKNEALQWAAKANYPVVFKLKGGAGSQNVILVGNRQKATRLIRKMFGKGIKTFNMLDSGSTFSTDFGLQKNLKVFLWRLKKRLEGKPAETVYHRQKNYALFQEFLPGNNFDTRVTIIGNRAFAYRRLNRINDFRSSGSGRLDHDPGAIDLRCVQTAHEISKKMGFQSMAYDFLYDRDGSIRFSEISYSFVDEYVYRCKGYWDRDLKWHEGHNWPQYCQLQDLLNLPDLKQPEIS